MSRAILLAFLAVTLAACSGAGPGGYGYAANGRPTLEQLSITLDNANNPFRPSTPEAATLADLN